MVDADVLIDDKPENVMEWSKKEKIAILFDQPWNQSIVGCPRPCVWASATDGHIYRAKGWGEVADVIRDQG
jgi:5'(3')-deoxyribonucleotidase